MKKTAVMPSRADVINTALFLKNYQKVWGDTVDKLIIHINSPMEKPIIDFMQNELFPRYKNVESFYTPNYVDHGNSLTFMVNTIKEGIVIFLEEDSLVLSDKFITSNTELIENGTFDAIGVTRQCCSEQILVNQEKYFGSRWHLSPYFSFVRIEDLKKTDLNFCAKAWYIGDSIPILNINNINENMAADTFVWMSIQLRSQKLRIKELTHFDGGTVDEQHFFYKTGIFSKECDRVHHHTLILDYLITDTGSPLSCRESNPNYKVNWSKNPSDKINQSQIVAWTFAALETVREELGEIDNFINEYVSLVNKNIQINNLDINLINRLKEMYKWKINL